MERTLNKVTVLESTSEGIAKIGKDQLTVGESKGSSAMQTVLQAPKCPQERCKNREKPTQEQAQLLRDQLSLAAQEVNWTTSPKQFKD